MFRTMLACAYDQTILVVVRNRIVSNLRKDSIDCINNILWKWPLLKNLQILIQLLDARGTNDDGIATLGGKSAVVGSPSKRRRMSRDVMLRSDFSHAIGRSIDTRLDISGRIKVAKEMLRNN